MRSKVGEDRLSFIEFQLPTLVDDRPDGDGCTRYPTRAWEIVGLASLLFRVLLTSPGKAFNPRKRRDEKLRPEPL